MIHKGQCETVVIKCCRLCARQCHDMTIGGGNTSVLYSLCVAGSDSDREQQIGGSGGGCSSKLSMDSYQLKKKKVVVHSSVVATDINPLKPCGMCNEWLKKIAEPNPNFKVLTFTEADCSGVYITLVLD